MTATPLSVHAIVLSYNDCPAVIRCVESLRASTYAALRVVVVDNASADGTAAELGRRLPDCRLILNDRNLGFGSGCNVGIGDALANGADLVLLVNQDTVVAPDLVARLVSFMESHPAAGIVGPKTYSYETMPDGSPKVLYAGSWQGRLPLGQRLPGIESSDSGGSGAPVPTDYVWGHGMMIRAAALRQVGPFDPAFFMYYEDIDLCRRMKAAKHEIWFEPRAVMWHDTPDGARAIFSERWRWECKVESAAIFHRKYYGRGASGLLTSLTVLAETRQLVRSRRFLAVRHLLGAYTGHLAGRRRVHGPPAPQRTTASGNE